MGYFALSMRLKQTGGPAMMKEKFANAIIIGGFTWKFSVILFDPVSVWKYPLSLLYFDGGQRGAAIGVILAAAYFANAIRKDHTTLRQNAELFVVGSLAAYGTSKLLAAVWLEQENSLLVLAQLILALLFLAWCYRTKLTFTWNQLYQLGLWWSISMMAVLFLEQGRTFFWFSFSLTQIGWLAASIVCYAGSFLFGRKGEN